LSDTFLSVQYRLASWNTKQYASRILSGKKRVLFPSLKKGLYGGLKMLKVCPSKPIGNELFIFKVFRTFDETLL
jgi:hypothetical protein